MKRTLLLLGFWIVLTVAAPLTAFAAVTPTSSTITVQSNAQDGLGASDPDSATSTGQSVSAVSDLFVATAHASGAYATQTIAKGRRFGGNGTGDANTSGAGQSAFGKGKTTATFSITDLTYTYTVVGNLSLTGLIANGDDSATFRLVSVTTGQTLFERTCAAAGNLSLGTGGELPPGNYKIELEWNIVAASADGGFTSNFFQIDMSNPDEPPPQPPDDDEEDDNGTTMLWANSAGGAFGTAGNWSPDTVPGEDDIAAFKLITSYTVDVGAAHTLRVRVENGNATFINANYQLDGTSLNSPSMFIDDATLTLDGGSLTGGHALIGATDVSLLEVKNAGNLTLSGSMRVGGTAEGQMDISAGGKVTTGEGRVGNDATGAGFVTVSGLGSKWTSGNLAVGFAGPAEIRVDAGAILDSGSVTLGFGEGSSGLVTIEGDPESTDQARWNVGALTIGGAGTGRLEVLTVGEVDLTGDTIVDGSLLLTDGSVIDHSVHRVRIGVAKDGEVRVQGFDELPSRMVQITELTLGEGASGSLSLEEGGLIICATARTGIGAEGSAVVTGNGDGPSHWQVTGQLTLGESALSFVEIKAGGKVSAHDLVAGKNASGRAVITVGGDSDSSSSLLATTGNIILGLEGQAELKIEEEGLVTSEGGALGVLAGSIGRAVLGVPGASGLSAEWIVNGDLTLGGIGRGEIVVQNGATVTVDETLFILNNGFIGGTGSYSANFVQNGGEVAPGSSPGILVINADYEQTAAGTLTMEIGGTTPGVNQDQLVINGDATLGGKLVLKFIDDFVPAQGDQILLLNVSGTTTGAFADIALTGLEPGFEHTITTNENGDLVITALNDGVPLSSKGMFRGLLSGAPPAHAAAGFFTVRSNGRGAFSANFVLGGGTFAARGAFDADGKFSKVIQRRDGSPLTLNLELAVVGGARVIRGTLVDGATTIDIFAERGDGFHAKKAPAPQAGKYTAVLQFDPETSAAPQANGFALAVVTKGGVVILRGALADGQRLAHSTVLSKSGGWPVYVPLYAKKGALFGQLQFQAEEGSDFDGTLQWARPEISSKQGQLVAFVAPLDTIGSLYVAPPTRPTVLALPNGATATLADSAPLLTKNLTLSAHNRFVVTDPGADKFALSAAAGNGLVSAQFIHPSTGKTATAKGVLFQKGNFATGFFLQAAVSGSFEVRAKP